MTRSEPWPAKDAAVHPTAIVEEGAVVEAGARVGPYCHVGGDVTLKAGAELKSHVVLEGRTTIGARTVVYPFAMLGGPPQHLNYKGEDTALVVGEDVVVREHAAIHRAAPLEDRVTEIAAGAIIMSGAHIGHNCKIGPRAIVASNAALGGHVKLEEGAFLGGLSCVHQFCRIGAFAFVGGGAAVAADVIPYASVLGNRAFLGGLNIIGLKRAGLPREVIQDMRAAYRELFEEDGAFRERLDPVAARYAARAEVMRIVDFIREDARRPILGPRR